MRTYLVGNPIFHSRTKQPYNNITFSLTYWKIDKFHGKRSSPVTIYEICLGYLLLRRSSWSHGAGLLLGSFSHSRRTKLSSGTMSTLSKEAMKPCLEKQRKKKKYSVSLVGWKEGHVTIFVFIWKSNLVKRSVIEFLQ